MAPYKIGVTGGIGSGKSLVCQVLEVLKIPVYYADERAKWLMNHDAILVQNIKSLLGEASYQKEAIDRQYIASQVYSNPEKLERLNKLVHPAVSEDFESWIKEQRSGIVAKEAALLFESGSYQNLDQTWLVTSPKELRLSRVMKRDPQRSREQVLQIMDKQWKEEKTQKMADVVITNDEKHLLLPQILIATSAILLH